MAQHDDILKHLTLVAEKRIRSARRLQAQEAQCVSIELTMSLKKIGVHSTLTALASRISQMSWGA